MTSSVVASSRSGSKTKLASSDDTNFIVDGRFKAHAVRDGNLVTGQQQYSGVAAARSMITALGI